MPALVNSIGAYTFIDLRGNLDPRQERLELLVRQGYDGLIARRTGSRGEPFSLTTVSYATDFETAKDVTFAFKALVGSDPLTIVKYSVDWGEYLLRAVRETQCRAMLNSTAGAYGVRMEHQWEFVG